MLLVRLFLEVPWFCSTQFQRSITETLSRVPQVVEAIDELERPGVKTQVSAPNAALEAWRASRRRAPPATM